MFSVIRQLFKRKRKIDAPINHPDYFYTEEELRMMEFYHHASLQIARMLQTLPNAQEAMESFVASFSIISRQARENPNDQSKYSR
jgi:hypothetical protein